MDRSDVTPTLLHAILKNQASISSALSTIADWIELDGSPEVAWEVRTQLRHLLDSHAIVGACIGALMKPN